MLRLKIISTIMIAGLLTGCGNNEKKAGQLKVKAGAADAVTTAPESKMEHILFFGTSLTAGYGLDPDEGYPALIQKKIDSAGLKYKVINAGLSGETSAGGKSRVDWLLKQPVAVFVLELGANDGLRGLSVSETKANLQVIIDRVKSKYPHTKLVMLGMQMPPSMGAEYTADFKAVFSNLAKKNKMVYVPFLLEGVGGIPRLNQKDGIHPTAEGQKILAENVWVKLKSQL